MSVVPVTQLTGDSTNWDATINSNFDAFKSKVTELLGALGDSENDTVLRLELQALLADLEEKGIIDTENKSLMGFFELFNDTDNINLGKSTGRIGGGAYLEGATRDSKFFCSVAERVDSENTVKAISKTDMSEGDSLLIGGIRSFITNTRLENTGTVTIDTSAHKQVTDRGNNIYGNGNDNIVVDYFGNIYVVSNSPTSYVGYLSKFDINTKRWTTNEIPGTGPASNYSYCSIALDSANNIHLVTRGAIATNSTSHSQIKYRKYTVSTDTWSTEEVLTSNTVNHEGYAMIAVSSDDTVHIVYSGYPSGVAHKQVRHAIKSTSDSAFTITTVNPSEYPQENVVIYMDKNDNIHCAFSGIGPSGLATVVINYMKYSNGSWTNIEQAASMGGSYHQYAPVITVDENTGFVYLAFHGKRAGDANNKVRFAYWNGTWHGVYNIRTDLNETQVRPTIGIVNNTIQIYWMGYSTTNSTYQIFEAHSNISAPSTFTHSQVTVSSNAQKYPSICRTQGINYTSPLVVWMNGDNILDISGSFTKEKLVNNITLDTSISVEAGEILRGDLSPYSKLTMNKENFTSELSAIGLTKFNKILVNLEMSRNKYLKVKNKISDNLISSTNNIAIGAELMNGDEMNTIIDKEKVKLSEVSLSDVAIKSSGNYNTNYGNQKKVVIDSVGNMYCFFDTGSAAGAIKRDAATGTWTDIVMPTVANSGYPSVEMDENDVVHLVYRVLIGSDTKLRVVYHRLENDVWSDRMDVMVNTSYDRSIPDLAISKDGTHIYVICNGPAAGSNKNQVLFSESTDSGKSWSDERLISSNRNDYDTSPYATVMMDSNGDPHIIYGERELDTDVNLHMHHATRHNGSWTTTVKQDPGRTIYGMTAAIDDNDVIHVVIKSNAPGLIYAKYTKSTDLGKTWDTISTISTLDKHVTGPTISFGNNGVIYVMYNQTYTTAADKQLFLNKFDGSSWSPSLQMTTGENNETPILCRNIKSDQPIYIWSFTPGDDKIYVNGSFDISEYRYTLAHNVPSGVSEFLLNPVQAVYQKDSKLLLSSLLKGKDTISLIYSLQGLSDHEVELKVKFMSAIEKLSYSFGY